MSDRYSSNDDEQEWTVVKRKKHTTRKRRVSGENGAALRQSTAGLRSSTDEMNADLLPSSRAELSSRPRRVIHGTHAASTSNTIRRGELLPKLSGPNSFVTSKERLPSSRDSPLVDEFGISAKGLATEGIEGQGFAIGSLEHFGESLNKRKRWDLLLKEGDRSGVHHGVNITQKREWRFVQGGFMHKNHVKYEMRASELPPRRLVAPPTVVRGTRGGTQVRRSRVPGKRVWSRAHNLEKHSEWASGAFLSPQERGQSSVPLFAAERSALELQSAPFLEEDVYVRRRAANLIPLGRRQQSRFHSYSDRKAKKRELKEKRRDMDPFSLFL